MRISLPASDALQAFGQNRPLVLSAFGVVAMAAIVWLVGELAGGPVNDLLLYLPGSDKALHFAGFFMLFHAGSRLLRTFLPGQRTGVPLLVMAVAAIAVGDELGQTLRTARSLEMADLVAGMCGLAFGVCWLYRADRHNWPAVGAVFALTIAGYITFDSFSKQRHVSAAIRFARAGDLINARHEYRSALDAGLRTASVYNELGWLEIESGVGDARAAVAFAEKALELRPDDVDIIDTYGWALHHAGRSAEALPHLERAYAEKPDMFCIHYHLGEVYLALAQTDKATMHLREQLARTGTREAARAAQTLAALGH